jgi:nucleoside-diphosphate-sugar epimerase
MKNVLITGATGFIGKYVLSELLKQDTKIFSVERSSKQGKILDKRINVIETDDLFSESIEWWEKNCTQIDVVLHLAWFTKSRDYLNSYKNIDCLTGSLNLARGAVLAGVQRFIGIGTCIEYDLTHRTLTVNTPLKPTSLYAATKAGLFLNLTELFQLNSVDFTWCRIFNVYGDSEDKNRLIPFLKSKFELDQQVNLPIGEQVRDFIDILEVAKIISEVTLSTRVGPINVCSGVPKSIKEIALQVADQYQKRHLVKFTREKDELDSYSYIVGVPNY